MSDARPSNDPRLEATIEAMFLAAHADGEVTAAEIEHFSASVESLTDRRIVGADLGALVARIERALTAEGRGARLESIRERLPAGAPREVALALAVRLMAADGLVRTSERELILEMAEALEIDREVAARIVREASA